MYEHLFPRVVEVNSRTQKHHVLTTSVFSSASCYSPIVYP